MEELKDLVSVAFSKRIGKIEIINSESVDKKSAYFRLADGILKGKFKSDNDAANELVGKSDESSAYKMLKKRLKERLYNTLLFLQPLDANPNSYNFQVYECYKLMVLAKLLMLLGFNKTASKIMTKLMTKAKHIELFEVIQQCAIALQRKS